ncbi:MAG: RIP metalloprotease RseP [Myxococcota bacterium]|jgi:regulator of sigma E protease|nr:RIP metalloprotease RseP [Myxococcota bacterium]
MELVLDVVQTVASFVVLIGVLVFVHELGHFLFAKLFKVKVHTFALGMGPRVVGFQKGETDYRLAAFPIGGYVKMLGEDPSEVLGLEDKGRAFGDKPIWQRLIIVAGGPVFSIAFPLILYFAIRSFSFEIQPALIGAVVEGMPAHVAGLRPGDRILSVNGEPVRGFEQLTWLIEDNGFAPLKLAVRRGESRLELSVSPKAVTEKDFLDAPKTTPKLGVGPMILDRAFIGVRDGSIAAAAGLRSFELVTTVNGKPVHIMEELEKLLLLAAGNAVSITVRTLSPELELPLPLGEDIEDFFEPAEKTVSLSVPKEARSLADLGLETSRDYVFAVAKDSNAAAIGLTRGDKLLSVDGKVPARGSVLQIALADPDKPHTLGWQHGQQRREAQYSLKFVPAGEAGKLGLKKDIFDPGLTLLFLTDALEEPNPALLSLAWQGMWRDMRENSTMMLDGISALLTGKISLQTMGGPLMIGDLASTAAKSGLVSFLWMMALISLNLGIINLFPIPVLDGGQIVFISIEGLLRRPVDTKIKERILIFGVVLLVALLVFATRNDIMRFITQS